MFSKFSVLCELFLIRLLLVNGRKSLWEVPEEYNVTGSDYFDDVWVEYGVYPAPKSTLISAATWKDGIVPYKIDDKYFDFDKVLIVKSMEEISKVSCIQFVEKSDGDKDFLHIRNLYNCASHIGFTGKEQPLALSAKMCMSKGIIIHELMHALGFVHEHCRSDRDSYIVINKANIPDFQWHNFVKYELGLLNYWDEKYDFDSIMHYDAFAHAIDKSKPAIKSLVAGGNLNIRETLSAADITKLNKLYNC